MDHMNLRAHFVALRALGIPAYADLMTTTRTKRLSRTDWLLAGLSVLRDKGGRAILAEPMARHMGTTKGSFYWHFKDLGDFHSGILAQWEVAATTQMQQILDSETSGVSRLRALTQAFSWPDPKDPTLGAEHAIRCWAASEAAAARAVAEIDTARLDVLGHLLQSLGINNPEMTRLIYASAIGMAGLPSDGQSANHNAVGSLIDLVLALR